MTGASGPSDLASLRSSFEQPLGRRRPAMANAWERKPGLRRGSVWLSRRRVWKQARPDGKALIGVWSRRDKEFFVVKRDNVLQLALDLAINHRKWTPQVPIEDSQTKGFRSPGLSAWIP